MSKGRISYEFVGEQEGELSVFLNEIVDILSVGEDGWSEVQNGYGKIGLIPTEYYEMVSADDECNNSSADLTASSSSSAVANDSSGTGGTNVIASGNTKKKKESRGTRESPLIDRKKAIGSIRHKLLRLHYERMLLNYIREGECFIRERHRANLLGELLETERTYVSGMQVLRDFFLTPLKQAAKDKKTCILDEAKTKEIFSNLEQIIMINETFLKGLESASSAGNGSFQIGKLFKEITPYMKAYSTYINNYDNAFEAVEKYEKGLPKFADFLEKVYAKKEVNRFKIDSFLILPVQRIPRYKLLLVDLLKSTPDDHQEKKEIEKVLEEIIKIAAYVNEGKRKNENSKVLLDLARKFRDKYGSQLVQAHRQYVREDFLELSNPEKKLFNIEFKAYCFTDILILIPSGKSSKKAQVFFLFFAYTDFKSSAGLEIRLESFNEASRRTFMLFFDTEEKKTEWERILQERIQTEKMSVSNKGIQVDLMELGAQRTQYAQDAVVTQQHAAKVTKDFYQNQKQLQQTEQDIEQLRQQVLLLQHKIARKKQDKANFEQNLTTLHSSQLALIKKLNDDFKEIRERDSVFLQSLKNETDAFVQVFGEKPPKEQDQSKLVPQQLVLLLQVSDPPPQLLSPPMTTATTAGGANGGIRKSLPPRPLPSRPPTATTTSSTSFASASKTASSSTTSSTTNLSNRPPIPPPVKLMPVATTTLNKNISTNVSLDDNIDCSNNNSNSNNTAANEIHNNDNVPKIATSSLDNSGKATLLNSPRKIPLPPPNNMKTTTTTSPTTTTKASSSINISLRDNSTNNNSNNNNNKNKMQKLTADETPILAKSLSSGENGPLSEFLKKRQQLLGNKS